MIYLFVYWIKGKIKKKQEKYNCGSIGLTIVMFCELLAFLMLFILRFYSDMFTLIIYI